MAAARPQDHPTGSAIDAVMARNDEYADRYTGGGLPGRPPRLKLAVLSCLDCRLHVPELLGLELGDAHILRNAGGVVTEDVLRSLIVSYHIGGTRELMIINNTKCGMLTFTDEELASRLRSDTGKAPVVPARFLTFTDLVGERAGTDPQGTVAPVDPGEPRGPRLHLRRRCRPTGGAGSMTGGVGEPRQWLVGPIRPARRQLASSTGAQ